MNAHHEGAIAGLIQAADSSGEITETVAMAAVQTQAILAMAYEQHTANLIALAELKRKDRTSGATAASTEIIMIIEQRLDLA